jgi:hypothetical protein
MLRFRLLWVLPGANFGLYFFVWRSQDLRMDAMKTIPERDFGSDGGRPVS